MAGHEKKERKKHTEMTKHENNETWRRMGHADERGTKIKSAFHAECERQPPMEAKRLHKKNRGEKVTPKSKRVKPRRL